MVGGARRERAAEPRDVTSLGDEARDRSCAVLGVTEDCERERQAPLGAQARGVPWAAKVAALSVVPGPAERSRCVGDGQRFRSAKALLLLRDPSDWNRARAQVVR